MKLPHKLGILKFFSPNKTIPITPWSGKHPWDFGFQRLTILISGLAIFGIGDAFIIVSGLGNAPWSVLAQGVSLNLGISIGAATFAIGVLVLLLWIPLKRRIGLATVLNIFVISAFIDIGLKLIPNSSYFLINLIFVFLGILFVGIGSALYLTCNLGAGPRDGLMTGLHEKSGVRVGRIRLIIELTVLSLGALLGGAIGLGTALFALLIGESIAISLGVVSRATKR
jgi:uncharacterized membrane protein YczE